MVRQSGLMTESRRKPWLLEFYLNALLETKVFWLLCGEKARKKKVCLGFLRCSKK